MTPEQATAFIVSVTGLIAALGVAIAQFRSLRRDINGRLTQLLTTAAEAARKDGELAGRDFAHRTNKASAMGGAGTAVPLTPNE